MTQLQLRNKTNNLSEGNLSALIFVCCTKERLHKKKTDCKWRKGKMGGGGGGNRDRSHAPLNHER